MSQEHDTNYGMRELQEVVYAAEDLSENQRIKPSFLTDFTSWGWTRSLPNSVSSPNKLNPILLPSCECRHCGHGVRMKTKRVIVAAALAGLVLMIANRVPAQDLAPKQTAVEADQPPSDDDITLFRKDVRSLRKQIIAANLDLTDTEAQQFWPIFDRYTAEMRQIFDRKFEVLKEYAANYDTITDEQADAYIKGRAAVEESVLRLRLKYIPIFRKVLSGKTAALFTQIDWRLGLVIDLQLASQVPIIQP